jgi:hypothetical protein
MVSCGIDIETVPARSDDVEFATTCTGIDVWFPPVVAFTVINPKPLTLSIAVVALAGTDTVKLKVVAGVTNTSDFTSLITVAAAATTGVLVSYFDKCDAENRRVPAAALYVNPETSDGLVETVPLS